MVRFSIVSLFLLVLVVFGSDLGAQVASPHNFPHAVGSCRNIFAQTSVYPDVESVSMGMDGWVAVNTFNYSSPDFNFLLDSMFVPGLSWTPGTGAGFTAINKDHKVWWACSTATDTRVSVFSETGTLYNQFKCGVYRPVQFVADTSGHVYLILRATNVPGFGVVRFGASYTPDYSKWITTGGGPVNAEWGIDQRLYVNMGSQVCAVDANGDVCKVILSHSANFAVYQDHGIATVTFGHDTVMVARRDSNMNLLWSTKFRPGTAWNNPVYDVQRCHAVAMPGSDDLIVVATTRNNTPNLCSNSQETYDTRTFLFDKNGVLKGMKGVEPGARQLQARSTPYGDPLILSQFHGCMMGGTVWNLAAYVLPGYTLRPACDVVGTSTVTYPYVPTSNPMLGSASVASFTPSFVPDALSMFFSGTSSSSHLYQCKLPCATVTPTNLGGGLVSFSDEIYGFYSCSYDFGDGSFGTTTDPVHQYAGSGPYPMQLTATNACGMDTSVTLLVDPCISGQIVMPTPGCVGTQAVFQEGSGLPSGNLSWLVNGVAAGVGSSMTWSSATLQGAQIGLVNHDGVCFDTVVMNYSYLPTLVAALGADTLFCPDTTWLLSGPAGAASYLWSTGATTQTVMGATADTVWLEVVSPNGCISQDTVGLTLSTDCVWPGDANHDGVADNLDVLAVGYGFGANGFVRPAASLQWYGQMAPDWAMTLPGSVDYKHVDCNGNATIDFQDTVSISTHYGQTHNKAGEVTTGVPLMVVPERDSFPVGDTVFFNVHWGDANNPVSSGHGVAFTLQIDAQQVTPGTVSMRYLASFLGSGVPDLLTFAHSQGGGGEWNMAISRMDQVGHTGAGAIVRVGFLPSQVYPLTSSLGYVPVRLLNATGVDEGFTPRLVACFGDSIFVSSLAIFQTEGLPLTGWQVYPVPAAGDAVLEIDLAFAAEVEASVVDLNGRKLGLVLPLQGLAAGRSKVTIGTEGLSAGMYFVRLNVDGKVGIRKLVVTK